MSIDNIIHSRENLVSAIEKYTEYNFLMRRKNYFHISASDMCCILSSKSRLDSFLFIPIYDLIELTQYMMGRVKMMNDRNLSKNMDSIRFNSKEFITWCIDNGILEMWQDYINSGKNHNIKPCVDRIDPLSGYMFSNMQLMTFRANMLKGTREDRLKYPPLGNKVYLWNMDGVKVGEFSSHKKAAKYLKCSPSSIHKAVKGELGRIKNHLISITDNAPKWRGLPVPNSKNEWIYPDGTVLNKYVERVFDSVDAT